MSIYTMTKSRIVHTQTLSAYFHIHYIYFESSNCALSVNKNISVKRPKLQENCKQFEQQKPSPGHKDACHKEI